MKKRLLVAVLALSCTFTLASCNGEISFSDKTETVYPTNAVNEKNNTTVKVENKGTETPDYTTLTEKLSIVSSTSQSTSVETTVDMVYDSVVSIQASSVSGTSAGSGVLFEEDTNLGLSYLVTCFHVIDDASIFSITTSDGETYAADLVGGYEDMDLAVLSVEKTGLNYCSFFEDSDSLHLGSSVVCIGNPLGTLPGSVSAGVVSYVNRSIQVDSYTKRNLIQTDVAINSGNSGGGLFNTAGALIGIVNAKYSSSGIEGLGFAIPSNDVVSTVKSILATAKYDKANKCFSEGYVVGDYEFGFEVTLGYYTSGYGFNVVRNYVYYVSSVESNTTYTGTELKKQDVITKIDVDYKDESKTDTSLTVTTDSDIMKFLYSLDLSVNDTLVFTVNRNNVSTTVNVNVNQFIYSI